MPDLRTVLDRESQRFELAPRALDRMFERRQRRIRARRVSAIVVAVLVFGVTAWSVVSLSRLDRTRIAHRPAPGQTLEGTWRSAPLTERDVVRAFVAAGGTETTGRAFFSQLGTGPRRYAVITLRFDNGSFTELESADGGPPLAGYHAGYSVSSDGVLTISSPLRCTGTYSFAIDKGRLRLRVVHQCGRHDGVYNTTLFASFVFTKQR
jgi:hypothetical protein